MNNNQNYAETPNKEDKSVKSFLIRLLIAFCISAVLLILLLFVTGFFTQTSFSDKIRSAADSVLGICAIFFGAALLILGKEKGAFAFFSYNGRQILSGIIPLIKEDSHKSYAEYLFDLKQKKLKKAHLVTVGLIYFAAEAVLLIIWAAIIG